VLSDYGKGGLAHVARMIAAARRHGKPVLVDPRVAIRALSRRHACSRRTARVPRGRRALERRADLARRAQKLRADLDLEALS
jgi:bifunctional ADP-heptose synthase (sugar kinase/adenylyltransferase)